MTPQRRRIDRHPTRCAPRGSRLGRRTPGIALRFVVCLRRGLLRRRLPNAHPGTPTPEVAEVVAKVKRYFAGEEIDFSGVALDLGEQDAFFRQIYDAARQVTWGHTTTYGTLAKQLGVGPEAARDVGQAMAKNPVALIIPCHRVLAAGGKIGGFSAPGGSNAKARMLELEGVQLAPPKPVQQSLGF